MVLAVPQLPLHCEVQLRDSNLPWEKRLQFGLGWLSATRGNPDFYFRIALTILYRELCDGAAVPESEKLLQESLGLAKGLWNREKRSRWWGSLAVLDGYRAMLKLNDRRRAQAAFASVLQWGIPARRGNFVNSTRAAIAAGTFEAIDSAEYEKWFSIAGEAFRRGVSQIEDVTLKPRQMEVRRGLEALRIARVRRDERRMPEDIEPSPFLAAIRKIIALPPSPASS